ncbi:hypothetical protein ACFLX2_00660 [Candidatus Dependentiae bacterium]
MNSIPRKKITNIFATLFALLFLLSSPCAQGMQTGDFGGDDDGTGFTRGEREARLREALQQGSGGGGDRGGDGAAGGPRLNREEMADWMGGDDDPEDDDPDFGADLLNDLLGMPTLREFLSQPGNRATARAKTKKGFNEGWKFVGGALVQTLLTPELQRLQLQAAASSAERNRGLRRRLLKEQLEDEQFVHDLETGGPLGRFLTGTGEVGLQMFLQGGAAFAQGVGQGGSMLFIEKYLAPLSGTTNKRLSEASAYHETLSKAIAKGDEHVAMRALRGLVTRMEQIHENDDQTILLENVQDHFAFLRKQIENANRNNMPIVAERLRDVTRWMHNYDAELARGTRLVIAGFATPFVRPVTTFVQYMQNIHTPSLPALTADKLAQYQLQEEPDEADEVEQGEEENRDDSCPCDPDFQPVAIDEPTEKDVQEDTPDLPAAQPDAAEEPNGTVGVSKQFMDVIDRLTQGRLPTTLSHHAVTEKTRDDITQSDDDDAQPDSQSEEPTEASKQAPGTTRQFMNAVNGLMQGRFLGR